MSESALLPAFDAAAADLAAKPLTTRARRAVARALALIADRAGFSSPAVERLRGRNETRSTPAAAPVVEPFDEDDWGD